MNKPERRTQQKSILSLFKTREKREEGISIIILTYDRPKGLDCLLTSLLRQQLKGTPLEIIICNNYGGTLIPLDQHKKILNMLEKTARIRIINSNFNWYDRIRYSLAAIAKYDTILFIDDDIYLIDPNFIQYMYTHYLQLDEIDILSCWNSLWTEISKKYFRAVGLSFQTQAVKAITQTDICGTGISMFNRRIILNSNIFDIATSRDNPNAFDMAFSLAASFYLGSKGYFLPSFGMLGIHEDHKKSAIHNIQGTYEARFKVYKSLYKKGYLPVINRPEFSTKKKSPEKYAIQQLESRRYKW